MNAIIGDLHGDFFTLKRLIEHNPEWESVTIAGDVGVGFPGTFNPPFKPRIPVYFIRGNHDNPGYIKQLNWPGFHYIPDGEIRDGVLYIGGAFSIDYQWRTPGYTWWLDEELSKEEGDAILKMVHNYTGQIHTVVTHDAPYSLYPSLGIYDAVPSRTAYLLSDLYYNVLSGEKRPSRWIFGHHHKSFVRDIFRGMNVAQSWDVEYL